LSDLLGDIHQHLSGIISGSKTDVAARTTSTKAERVDAMVMLRRLFRELQHPHQESP
jgi:hypothetical protein